MFQGNQMIYGQVSGKKLKKWIQFHVSNDTEHTAVAMKMRRYLNVGNKGKYIVIPRNRVATDGSVEAICPEILSAKKVVS